MKESIKLNVNLHVLSVAIRVTYTCDV